jgi:NAD(P)-dependent dehydrogenase (short-subunit alcohol dehydrogenase family)
MRPSPTTDFSPAKLEAHMRANVTAPILLAQALHAATPAGAQAVVINLLDQKLYNLNPDYLSYTLSKAALHTATTMLAQQLAPAYGEQVFTSGIGKLETAVGMGNQYRRIE